MSGIISVWCFVLCALAIWLESLRRMRAMRKQAEGVFAFCENSGRRSEQNLPAVKMQYAPVRTERLPQPNSSQSGAPGALAERDSKMSIKLNSPWLYLSLVLILGLLVL